MLKSEMAKCNLDLTILCNNLHIQVVTDKFSEDIYLYSKIVSRYLCRQV